MGESLSKIGETMQAMGTEDATGANTYTTIITPSKKAAHVYISLGGSNDAIISFNGGTTDHLVVRAGSWVQLSNLYIKPGVAIQGKNKTTDSNYTNLNISVW